MIPEFRIKPHPNDPDPEGTARRGEAMVDVGYRVALEKERPPVGSRLPQEEYLAGKLAHQFIVFLFGMPEDMLVEMIADALQAEEVIIKRKMK